MDRQKYKERAKEWGRVVETKKKTNLDRSINREKSNEINKKVDRETK